jgi:RHS repeat-associated protein
VAGDVLSDGFNQYQYDAEGRIASVGTAISCIYDAEGRRVGKTDGTRYIVGLGGEIIDALQGTSWQRTEVYAGGRHLATVSSAGVSFDHGDWIGTERARTSAIGELCQETSSEPFGDGAQSGTPSGAAACSPTPDFLTGKPRDSESNLDDFGARYFNSRYGQWMSPDWSGSPEAVPYASLADPQSMNLYAYAGNDPVDGEDPDGHSIYSLGNGIYDNLSGLQQHVMDTDEARPASGDNHSVQCNSFLCSLWDALKSSVHVGIDGGSAEPFVQETIFALEIDAQAKNLHQKYPQIGKAANAALLLGTDGLGGAAEMGEAAEAAETEVTASDVAGPDGPYRRPNNATTQAQRDPVQGKPCATCGVSGQRNNADHIDPLVEQHYRGGVDLQKMRSPNAVRPQCPSCSGQQGGYLKTFSNAMKHLFGLNQ